MQKKRRKKKNVFLKSFALALGIIVTGILALYLILAIFFKSHFFYNTTLNGLKVGGKTAEDAQKLLETEAKDYLLTVFDRDGNKYLLKGADFNYAYESTGGEEQLVKDQKPFSWPAKIWKDNELVLQQSVKYDEAALNSAISELDCFQNMTKPTDAYIGKTDEGYQIIAETKGNTLLTEKVDQAVKEAIDQGKTQVTLTDECYESPAVTSTDENLKSSFDSVSSYLKAVITYDITGQNEVVDKKLISQWVTVNEDHTVSFDEKAVTSYVQNLATKYNTYGDVRDFKTTKGDTVKIGGGDYGWVIDKEKEKAKLIEEIKNGEVVTREPVYSQTAKSRAADDIGNTYVEIDFTNQHMYYYKDGQLQLESDVVTGNISKGNGSPDGIYKIVYKQSPAVLVGEDYTSPVQYFMVFAYNVGFHDATWRSQFGGQIYKTSGSHGCINMPPAKAKELYGILDKDTPIVAYYREPVTLTAENAKISNAYSYNAEAAAAKAAQAAAAAAPAATPATTDAGTPATN